MRPLKVSYDKPETVADMIRWLVDNDPIELRELALNLLDDVETLKAELPAQAVLDAAREWRATGEGGGFDHLAASLHLLATLDALDAPDGAA